MLEKGMHIRTVLGMPDDNESGIDKSDPRRIECMNCLHCDKAGTEHPCNICWNPIGDMFEPKTQPAKTPRAFVACKCCQGAGEIEVSNAKAVGLDAAGGQSHTSDGFGGTDF